MKKSNIFVLLEALAFLSVASSKICPKRVSTEPDKYSVVARFQKFVSASPSVSISHHHDRRNGEAYTYEIKFCTDNENDPAVKQISTEKKVEVALGVGSQGTIIGGVDWFMIEYRGGTKYSSHCNKLAREAWILVQCEEGTYKEEFRVIEEARWSGTEKNAPCYYLFEVNHPSACSRSAVKRARKISNGTIFCIVFVCLVFAYLVFGLLYMRFIAGAKGFEQIPHYSFWREVGNLAADGCDLVFRRPNHPANTYKGMADALNIDSSDDEKDDQLLPM